MVIEVCCENLESCMIAEQAGASRIELCSALCIGGLTPDITLVKHCMRSIKIPIVALIRSRAGNFQYNAIDKRLMLDQIANLYSLGIRGIAIGGLNDHMEIDLEFLKMIRRAFADLYICFHRAFDVVPNPIKSMEQLKQLKINSILSSGQAESALAGIPLLAALQKQSQDRITIMPGGGVNAQNARQIIEQANVTAIHGSFKKNNANIHAMGRQTFTDLDEIAETVRILS